MDLTFTADFNGYNVIFIFWLVLLVVPLFDKLEVSGISIKTRKQAQELKEKYKAEMKAAMEATDNAPNSNSDGLATLHKNVGQDE